VKTLLQALGVTYIVAPGEADAMCAQMVLKRKAHACASDDSDMFVYGCPRVLRHLNLLDQTIVMYDMSKILDLLGITMNEFRQICVVSGTDYTCCSNNNSSNSSNSSSTSPDKKHKPFHLHLKLTLKMFKQFKKCSQEAEETGSIVAPDFYTWLHHTCDTIHPRLKFDYDAITATHEIFRTIPLNVNQLLGATANNTINHELLHKVMSHENFIFV